jgi:hypothetical protein
MQMLPGNPALIVDLLDQCHPRSLHPIQTPCFDAAWQQLHAAIGEIAASDNATASGSHVLILD